MNLKESFRYQSFLDDLMRRAEVSLISHDHYSKTKKTHLKSKADENADDFEEWAVPLEEFYPNDEVTAFCLFLIDEKQKVSEAISKAKASCEMDIDAAVAVNKYRQALVRAMGAELKHKPKKYPENGQGYKFNNEGNQVMYLYDIEVETFDNFDRQVAKSLARKTAEKADEVSSKIDYLMINTQVDYEPALHVNDTFDDCMELFLSNEW